MLSSANSVRAATRWTTRIIPLVLTGCVGFSVYVVVKRACGMQIPAFRSFVSDGRSARSRYRANSDVLTPWSR